MTTDLSTLKAAIQGMLGAIAEEHPLSPQPSKAARYRRTSRDGNAVEIMFKKNDDSPPNLWCLEKAAGGALMKAQYHKSSPSISLWRKRGKHGKPLYRRHRALQKMSQRDEAELVYFIPTTLAEAREIIDRLCNVAAADLS